MPNWMNFCLSESSDLVHALGQRKYQNIKIVVFGIVCTSLNEQGEVS